MPTIDAKAVISMRDRLHPLLVALAKSKIKYDITTQQFSRNTGDANYFCWEPFHAF